MAGIKRGAQETFPEYFYRLFKDRVLLNLSNEEIAQLLNEELGTNYSESKFRKSYQSLQNDWMPLINKWLEAERDDADFSERLAKERDKINKENRAITKMLQDARREYNKLADHSARFEHIKKKIFEHIEAMSFTPRYKITTPLDSLQKELLVLMSDWHLGTEVKSSRNNFDIATCEKRVRLYLEETLRTIKEGDYKTVHLVNLGDMIAGAIHISSRVAAEEDVIQQIFRVTELISEFVSTVAEYVPQVHYYQVIGNHGRVVANKQSVSSHEDNFEKMIVWYLKARLKNFHNIEFYEDEDGLIETNILGESVIFAHGDLDRQVNGADKLSQMLGYIPQWLFLGHTHHNFEKSHGTTTTIVNPSIVGGDGYSISGRFGIQAAQKLVSFEKGKFGINHTVKLIRLN